MAEIRSKNGGKPPNIGYILLDDVGFGEIGMPDFSVVRGYDTPNINDFARSLQRMYTEPSCTPTRVAMLTGRYPIRTGLTEAKATIAGDGLSGQEVTIADNTVSIVMGDNGPFMQYARSSGQSNRIYRGGKADHLEGGVRVNAYIRWPGVIGAGSSAQDVFHVCDLFTTFARLGN